MRVVVELLHSDIPSVPTNYLCFHGEIKDGIGEDDENAMSHSHIRERERLLRSSNLVSLDTKWWTDFQVK